MAYPLLLGDLSRPMPTMPALLVGCVAASICLFSLGRNNEVARDLGTALLTGAVFAAVSLLAQKNFEDRDYLDSLAMAGDMNGFNDLGHNLEKAPLSDRSMHNAQLVDARMAGANLAFSDLSDAELRKADLRGASIFHTALDRADLRETDLRGAHLRGATFYRSWFPGTARLQHARADLNTCWPIALAPPGDWTRPDQPKPTGKAGLSWPDSRHLGWSPAVLTATTIR